MGLAAPFIVAAVKPIAPSPALWMVGPAMAVRPEPPAMPRSGRFDMRGGGTTVKPGTDRRTVRNLASAVIEADLPSVGSSVACYTECRSGNGPWRRGVAG